jgi:hypothetical protein
VDGPAPQQTCQPFADEKHPGFVGAYFVAVDDTHGISIEVYETEEQARVGAPPVGAEAPGVTVDAIQFGGVIGSACSTWTDNRTNMAKMALWITI